MSEHSVDERIVALFWARDERALSEFDRHYQALCLRVAENITENREDAMECLNDLYLRLWDTIPPQKPRSLKSFACEIMRNLALQCVRRQHAQKRSVILVELDDIANSVPYREERELGELIDAFLREQPKLWAILFVRRYYYGESVKAIAQRTGLSENKVSKILSKQRKMLREALREGGIRV